MTFDWNVYHFDYRDRIGNLTSEAQGVVKSKKYFPVFNVEGKEKVLKPLSKTKPLTTPYFAYSEVFWSTILHDYFDIRTPIYHLAICANIEEEYPDKYHHGTLVDKLEKKNRKLINLYELCRKNPDTLPDISRYMNYCEVMYDYVEILSSDFFKQNRQLGQEVANQILCSMLRQDQNYHYENMLFYQGEQELEIAQMIDHEFSTMFMYLDIPSKNKLIFNNAQISLNGVPDALRRLLREEMVPLYEREKNNLEVIVSLYPEVASEFLERLKSFQNNFSSSDIRLEDNGYIVPFNSFNFQVGQARYKEKNEKRAKELSEKLLQHLVTPDMVEETIQKQVLENSKKLEQAIEKRLILR